MSAPKRLHHVLLVLGIVLLLFTMGIFANYFFGHGQAPGPALTSSLSPDVGWETPTTSAPTTSSPSPTSTTTRATRKSVAKKKVVKTGVPVSVVVSSHGVKASVSANRLNRDKSLFVPDNPRKVSWWSGGVAPGASKGTTVLVSHINSGGVQGAFSDLPSYRVGQVVTLVMADGRKMAYKVASSPINVNKNAVSARSAELFDQKHAYGSRKTGRLLLLSCGGEFDNNTGHYESNIFVYALPV